MKNYIVTVNGVSYEVSVEEVGEGQAAAPAAAPVKAAPVKAAAPAQEGQSIRSSRLCEGFCTNARQDHCSEERCRCCSEEWRSHSCP